MKRQRSSSMQMRQGQQEPLLSICQVPESAEVFSQPGKSSIGFDGIHYTYEGYVLVGEQQYVRKALIFTPDDAGVLPSCDPERVRLMLDSVGESKQRQDEIRRYGRRRWHSPYRPESAVSQALDYAFAHGELLLASVLAPYLADLYASSASEADAWTEKLRQGYVSFRQLHERKPLFALLREKGVPDAVFPKQEHFL